MEKYEGVTVTQRVRGFPSECFLCLICLLLAPWIPAAVAQQLPPQVTTLLGQWLRDGADPESVRAREVNRLVNRNDQAIRESFQAELQRIAASAGDEGKAVKFTGQVLTKVDRVQMQLASDLAEEVANEFSDGVHAVIRTGSSGDRHMQLFAGVADEGRYVLLMSDDDISFFGPRGHEAAEKFNELKHQRGLGNARVQAFQLDDIVDATSYDVLVKQLRNPNAFMGAAGFGAIKGETLSKGGAVMLVNEAGGWKRTAQRVADYVAANGNSRLASVLDAARIAEDLRQFGPVTLYASCMRQLEHNTDARERVKYLLRTYAGMEASGAFRDAADITRKPEGYFQRVGRELAAVCDDKTGRQAAAFLARNDLGKLQIDCYEAVMVSTSVKLKEMVERAEREAGRRAVDLARHTDLRRMIRETAAGMALLEKTGHREALRGLIKQLEASGVAVERGSTFYKVLYTIAFDRHTLRVEMGAAEEVVSTAVRTWSRAREPRLLIEAMHEAGQAGAEQRRALAAIGSERMAGTKAGQSAAQMTKLLEQPHGDQFLWKMLNSETARKFMTEAVTLAPFALYRMYNKWQSGDMRDLSDAAFVLIEFIPGGMSLKPRRSADCCNAAPGWLSRPIRSNRTTQPSRNWFSTTRRSWQRTRPASCASSGRSTLTAA